MSGGGAWLHRSGGATIADVYVELYCWLYNAAAHVTQSLCHARDRKIYATQLFPVAVQQRAASFQYSRVERRLATHSAVSPCRPPTCNDSELCCV